jgi:hypothetical protein
MKLLCITALLVANVRYVPKADIAILNRSSRLRRCFGELFPRRCEELQCDSRKAIFSAANKAER